MSSWKNRSAYSLDDTRIIVSLVHWFLSRNDYADDNNHRHSSPTVQCFSIWIQIRLMRLKIYFILYLFIFYRFDVVVVVVVSIFCNASISSGWQRCARCASKQNQQLTKHTHAHMHTHTQTHIHSHVYTETKKEKKWYRNSRRSQSLRAKFHWQHSGLVQFSVEVSVPKTKWAFRFSFSVDGK